MFGIGGSEMIIILIVALIFLGPDKLPDAAKTISKGIRDLKRGSREIQQTIENDEHIGGALRDLRSALRGEDPPPKQVKAKPVVKPEIEPSAEADLAAAAALVAPAMLAPSAQLELPTIGANAPHDGLEPPALAAAPPVPVHAEAALEAAMLEAHVGEAEPPKVTLPPDAGDVNPDVHEGESDRAELAAMIKPAAGTVAKGALAEPAIETKPTESDRSHG